MISLPSVDYLNGSSDVYSDVDKALIDITSRVCLANSKGKKNTKFIGRNKNLLEYLELVLKAHGYKTRASYYDDDWGTYTLYISWSKYD